MDFDFSAEQYMFRDTVKTLLDAHFPLEKFRVLQTGDGFDGALWFRLAELGVFAMLVPVAYGGLGLNFVDLSLILEEGGRAVLPSPIAESLSCAYVIAKHGTPAQCDLYLPRAATGNLIATPALAEANAGYDPLDITLTAIRSADGWSVNGQKIMVAHAALANILLLSARLEENGTPALILIEPGRPGVALRQHETLDLSGRYFEVNLQDVHFDISDVVGGAANTGAVLSLFNANAVIAASYMAGIAGKVLDDTVSYVSQRVQFGKPIGSFQTIKHRCADMAVLLNVCRPAAYYAAWALAENAPDLARAVSLAKAACGEAARFICNEGIQLHGGMGFTWDMGLHDYLRRAKLLECSYGDSDFHRERVLQHALDGLA